MSFPINEKGSWIVENPQHCFDEGLNKMLLELLKGNSVFDFGCGDGNYLKQLKTVCPEIKGCDGNPYTEQLTEGLGFTADLSVDQSFGDYDWVISFEVGEHIPKEFEQVFIDNLCKHAKKGIVMSWAYPGQPGEGHINCQTSEYIIDQMYKRGFLVDYVKSNEFRDAANTWWFETNLLVFYNINKLK